MTSVELPHLGTDFTGSAQNTIRTAFDWAHTRFIDVRAAFGSHSSLNPKQKFWHAVNLLGTTAIALEGMLTINFGAIVGGSLGAAGEIGVLDQIGAKVLRKHPRHHSSHGSNHPLHGDHYQHLRAA